MDDGPDQGRRRITDLIERIGRARVFVPGHGLLPVMYQLLASNSSPPTIGVEVQPALSSDKAAKSLRPSSSAGRTGLTFRKERQRFRL